jgi:hypothetical protein
VENVPAEKNEQGVEVRIEARHLWTKLID